jgi:hypothetical protein
MTTKSLETYVPSRNEGLSLGEVHCSLGKLVFPWVIIMSLGRRNLSGFKEQLKPFFSLRIIMSFEEELKLPWEINVFKILFDHNFYP